MSQQTDYSIIKAQLNPPVFIAEETTFALLIKNRSQAYLNLKSITASHESLTDFIEGSAVMFSKGEKILLRATVSDNKISLEGITVPPRENALVFYKSELT